MASCKFKDIFKSDCYDEDDEKRPPLTTYNQISHDDWEVFLWRAKKEKTDVPDDITICRRHKLKIQGMFKATTCSDPLKEHLNTAQSNPKCKRSAKIGD